MTAIFVSHRSSDHAEAAAIKCWLADQGHEQLFLDFDPADGIPAGVYWEQRLYKELRRCQALLIVLTPDWLASYWCRNELAIAREKGKAIFVVRVKVCAGGPLIPAIQEVDLTTDQTGLEKLARGLREHGLDPASAFDWKPGRPIYPGLAAFDIDDAAIFFGRSKESWDVVEALRHMRLQAVGSSKLLLITGASGSGKSSMMRAGVLARLRKEPASWIVARPFRRGANAIAGLAAALAWAFPAERRPVDLAAITDRLTGANGAGELLALAEELRLALNRPDAALVIAIDQAEELLGAEQSGDAAHLLDLLRDALPKVADNLVVLATIRSDRLGAWQQHPSVKAGPEHGELIFRMTPLGPMPMDRLGDIVRGPAFYEGLEIDADLVDAIRTDTVTPDALPLLAYTLQYLHRHFSGEGRLRLTQYQSFGGLEGSVRSQADAAISIDTLSDEDRRALQDAFVPGLVRANADGGFSRGRAQLSRLPPRAEPHLRRLLDDARLLQTDVDAEGNATIEVAHESLLRVWPTLARWIAEDALKLRRLEALQRAAADWVQNGRGEDFLIHRDQRLADAETLIAEPRFAVELDTADRDYLATARTRQNRQEAQEKDARERELQSAQELAARRSTQVRVTLAAAVLLVAVAAGAAWQWREAVSQREKAVIATADAEHQLKMTQTTQSLFLADLARQRTEAGDAGTAMLLALEALPDDAAGRSRLYLPAAEVELDRAVRDMRERLAVIQGDQVDDALFSPNGELVLTLSTGIAKLWDSATGKPVGRPFVGDGNIRSAAFSLDGKQVVAVSSDRTIRLWDGQTGEPIGQPLPGQINKDVVGAAFSPDSRRFVSRSWNKTVQVWDATTGQAVGKPIPTNDVVQAVFDPDKGHIITVSQRGEIIGWEADGRVPPVRSVVTLNVKVRAAAFSPNREYVVIWDAEGPVKLWDTMSGKPVRDIGSGRHGFDYFYSAAFSPDGSRLVTVSEDSKARVWDIQTGELVAKPLHHEGVVNAAFSPDGKRVVTASRDGTARIWDVESRPSVILVGHNDLVSDAAFSPDGGRVVTTSTDGTARFWDVANGSLIGRLLIPRNGIEPHKWMNVAYSPDGTRLVTVSEQGSRLWDVATNAEIALLSGDVRSLSFSVDSQLIVTISLDKTVRVWDGHSGKPVGLPLKGHTESVLAAVFSPDGKQIVTVSADRTVQWWDTATGTPIGDPIATELIGAGTRPEIVPSIEFSTDRKTFLSSTGDEVRVLDPRTGMLIGAPIRGDDVASVAAGMSPDGERILTITAADTVRVWDRRRRTQVTAPLPGAGRVFAAAFSPNGTRIVGGFDDHKARLWTVSPNTQALVERAKALAPRCLTKAQREAFFLLPDPPAWCIEREKWPYHSDEWKQWLTDLRAGKDPPLPNEK